MADDMQSGLVSVIVPVYNRTAFLAEAVASAVAQTYRPVEIIVVDDGSTDGTVGLVDELAGRYSGVLRVVKREENGGVGVARECGRLIARGEFIQYLDSDDLLYPEKFERQVAALREHPDCGIAYGVTALIDGSGAVTCTALKGTADQHEFLLPRLMVERWWSTHTPLWRRSACDAVGPWAAMRACEDWQYEARAAALGVRLAFVPGWPMSATRNQKEGEHLSGRPMDRLRAQWLAETIVQLWRAAASQAIARDRPEAEHLSRWTFAHARACAQWGLAGECPRLLALAAPRGIRMRAEVAAFSMCGALAGWPAAGSLARAGEMCAARMRALRPRFRRPKRR
jgi:hypothetical protein